MYSVRLAMTFEEWKDSKGKDTDNNDSTEIVSGTEVPQNIMPGSPLEGMKIGKKVATTEVVVKEELSHTDYTPFVCTGSGFIIGCIITALFFKSRIKKITKEFEIKIGESRKSLDRIVQMMSQK